MITQLNPTIIVETKKGDFIEAFFIERNEELYWFIGTNKKTGVLDAVKFKPSTIKSLKKSIDGKRV